MLLKIGLHCKITVQVWAIAFGVEGFLDNVADRVSESGLAETYNAGQREPVATVLFTDLKDGLVYESACCHVAARGSSVALQRRF